MRRFYSRHFGTNHLRTILYFWTNKRTTNNKTNKEIFVQKDFSKFFSEADENLNIEVIGDMV